jgi:hypothetical protein
MSVLRTWEVVREADVRELTVVEDLGQKGRSHAGPLDGLGGRSSRPESGLWWLGGGEKTDVR